ncbi:sensor histidine kinase [Psychroserpens damuponensis]|uniref:sensor histidine kinase n=1 Tax=Psychroserpens damuponensis TaxID=943936 RepID=UPI000693863E|nr:ATP-binding protein [Psychroserpens damuponensis]
MLKKLWSSYHKWYIKYSGFSDDEDKDVLSFFRDKLFVSILILTLVLGVFSYFPSTGMALVLGEMPVVYINTAAILVIVFLFLNKRMSLQTKKAIFSINFFVLSFALVITLGLLGNGTLLLFLLNVLMTLYSGRRAGVISVLVTTVFYIIILFIYYFSWIDLQIFNEAPFEVFLIVFINNVLFGLLTVFSVSFLIDQLHSALLKEGELQAELQEKHNNVIIAKEKAEQSDKLKTAFLANMSHEIGTPMYGILGCAELLKSYNVGDEEYKEYVDVIEGNGKKLLDVITDILSVSKIDTGLMPINKTEFNINDSLQNIYNMFLQDAEAKDVHFSLNNFISKKDYIVNTDHNKFKEVLKHLIKNAIKYTSKGDSIVVSCSLDASNSSQLRFQIVDTGIGIPEDKLNAVFDSFYQVEVANRNTLNGSGLGLSIAKAYVRMLGGNLELESTEGKGTSIWFAIDMDL